MEHSTPSIEAWWERITADNLLPRPQGPALQLWQALERVDADLGELARLAQGDPSLTSRLLQLANSAAYADQRPAAAISADVLMRLGLATVRQLLLGFVLVDRFRTGRCPSLSLPRFWRQSLLRAVWAQHLGGRVRAAPPSECFTLGLLFDLGTVLLVEVEARACRLAATESNPSALRLRLLEHFGLSPLHLSGRLLHTLGLPQVFVEAIGVCAAEEESRQTRAVGRALQIGQVLHLAEQLALHQAQTPGPSPAPDDPTGWPAALLAACAALDLTVQEVSPLMQRVDAEWRDWCALFELAPATPTPPPRPRAMAARKDDGLSIVIIDDDPVLRRLGERLLAAPRRDVRSFASGREALDWLALNPAQVALVDLVLPGEDGWDLIARLRALPDGDRLHIIVLSALGDSDSVVRAFAAGADDYLTKPFDAEMVEARLLPARRKAQAQAATRQPLVDAATKLFNRAYLQRRLEQELALAHRMGRPLALLGLRFADAADLPRHIERLRQGLRASDIHGLWDEHTLWLLLPATDHDGMRRMLQRLRTALTPPASPNAPLPAVMCLELSRADIASAPASASDDWSGRTQALIDAFATQALQPYPSGSGA